MVTSICKQLSTNKRKRSDEKMCASSLLLLSMGFFCFVCVPVVSIFPLLPTTITRCHTAGNIGRFAHFPCFIHSTYEYPNIRTRRSLLYPFHSVLLRTCAAYNIIPQQVDFETMVSAMVELEACAISRTRAVSLCDNVRETYVVDGVIRYWRHVSFSSQHIW